MKRFQKFRLRFSYWANPYALQVKIHENKKLFEKFAYEAAKKYAEELKIPVFIVEDPQTMTIINSVTKLPSLSGGIYTYLTTSTPDERVWNIGMDRTISGEFYDRKLCFPRISLLHKENEYFTTFVHEIGHHMNRVRKIDNSEKNADLFVSEFIKTKLPEFFKLPFKFWIEIFDEHERKVEFTEKEEREYVLQCMEFIEANTSDIKR